MRLTSVQKEAFVRAVMDDTPRYDGYEDMEKALNEILLNDYPEDLKNIYKKYPEFIQRVYVIFPGHMNSNPRIVRPYKGDIQPRQTIYLVKMVREKILTEEAYKHLEKITDKHNTSREQFTELKTKLRLLVSGCSTLKQLKEALPEFEKYMPVEAAKSRNLPAVTNLVTDFVKAGWPKGGDKKAIKAPKKAKGNSNAN